jgi:hypothetical protein
MAKKALKEIYDQGQAHQKKVNLVLLDSKLSHALTVAGVVRTMCPYHFFVSVYYGTSES